MDIEINYGERVTPLVYEMSPLDQAIMRFEKQAKEYYRKQANLRKETPAERKNREKELAAALMGGFTARA